MPKNPFASNEETSFEQGTAANRPVKAISDAAKQQAKTFTNDFLAQLYGKSDKPADPNNPNDPNAQKTAAAAQQPQKTVHKLSGNSNVSDHAKYLARQQYLDKGDVKGADNAMHHLQYYFDANIMTLEDRAKKIRDEEERKKQEKKQQEEQEEQQKKEAEAKEREELPQATGKGRNRMGMPPQKKRKTNMAVDMGKNKAEMFRGASG